LYASIEIAALPIELAGNQWRDEPSAHEQHQQGKEQHRNIEHGVLGGGEAGLPGKLKCDAADANPRQHERQRLVAPFLGGRQQPRRKLRRQQHGERDIRRGRHDALRGTEKRGAGDQPQPGQQSEAQDGDGAELVAHDHGQGKAKQHFVCVSGADASAGTAPVSPSIADTEAGKTKIA
jgi:hypothetical protein